MPAEEAPREEVHNGVSTNRLYLPIGVVGVVLLLLATWIGSEIIGNGKDLIAIRATAENLKEEISAIKKQHEAGYHQGMPQVARDIAREETNILRTEIVNRLGRIETKLDAL